MDRFARARDVVDLEALGAAHVLVAGLGSGGSTVALELAKAGVKSFGLIDPDVLAEPNLIRHECDDRYLGWNKAEAVRDLIRRRNPEAAVEAIPADLLELGPRLETAVADASIVAACTDAEAPKRLLNRICLDLEVPAVYAGVYEKGVGGEVIRCPAGGGDACYACVTSALKDSTRLPGDDEELDYGAIGPDGTIHGAPGLGLDVRLIALLHAKVCLLELLGEPLDPFDDAGRDDSPRAAKNVLLFGTAPVEGLFSRRFASALLRVAPQEDCLICRPTRERPPVSTA